MYKEKIENLTTVYKRNTRKIDEISNAFQDILNYHAANAELNFKNSIAACINDKKTINQIRLEKKQLDTILIESCLILNDASREAGLEPFFLIDINDLYERNKAVSSIINELWVVH